MVGDHMGIPRTVVFVFLRRHFTSRWQDGSGCKSSPEEAEKGCVKAPGLAADLITKKHPRTWSLQREFSISGLQVFR
jgi:hypothetical protein